MNGLRVYIADAFRAGLLLIVGWSALTLPAPHVLGACLRASHWDASRSQIVLDFQPGSGCTVRISA